MLHTGSTELRGETRATIQLISHVLLSGHQTGGHDSYAGRGVYRDERVSCACRVRRLVGLTEGDSSVDID